MPSSRQFEGERLQSAQPANIERVMVDGRILKQGSSLTTIDLPKVVREANETIAPCARR